ncbi:MAG TPA: tripartite tricarboxylate transporter substrate binding protein [Burkholderiales bacterium]|nr:tripartite tricarboxylate transporter substrate binding protein [Burkholderiales bacterium]
MRHPASRLVAAIILLCAGAAAAQSWPSKPVRLVVPFAAGSATDSAGRLFAQALGERLGQPVVVENKAGANGQIAAIAVAGSAPDGYTLFMTTNSTHSANPHLVRNLGYDPVRDFVPIARVGTLPFMLVVHPGLPARTTAEFLAYARAHPGELSYGTASTASMIGAETLNAMAGLKLEKVGYKSSPQAILDLAAGRLQVMVSDFTTAMPHVRSGKLRVLAVTTATRSALLPEVPAIAESLPGFDMTSWNGIFAPAHTPPDIVARVERESLRVLADRQLQSRFATIGFEIAPLDAAQLDRYVRGEIAHWGKLVRAANIQPE